jgi:CHAD domain-containing protein
VSQSPLYGPFRKRLDAFAHEVSGVEQGNVEALHRTRVASRRLRELLPLLGMDRDTSQKLNRRLRRVTKQLGIVRELDVLILLIEEFRRNSRYPPVALKNVSLAVGDVRNTARERLTAKLPPAKLQRLAARLGRAARPFESDDATARRPEPHPISLRGRSSDHWFMRLKTTADNCTLNTCAIAPR